MNQIWLAVLWLFDPQTWEGRYGLANLFGEHLWLTATAILPAAIVALPLGVLVGHLGRGQVFVLGLSSAARAIPTLGLLLALVLAFGVEGRGFAVLLALAAIALPPLLAGAYSGVAQVPPHIVDAARAQGLSELQIILRVELPMAAPALVGGARGAILQVIATAILAPLVGLGGLGFGITQGLALRSFDQVIGSGIIVVLLALTIDTALASAQRRLTKRLGGARNAISH